MRPNIEILVAPAASGKTALALALSQQAAEGLAAIPRVLVASHLQAQSWRQRLAAAGGTIGVHVLTWERLYRGVLSAAGEVYVWLSEPVQYRLIRAVVDTLPLAHYAGLARSPGFIQVLEGLIAELKAAGIRPEQFSRAVAGLGLGPRLAELAGVYEAYQARLAAMGWVDGAGLALLAVAALEREPVLGRDWPLLIVDGFDGFTPVQRRCLELLAGRVGHLVLTLTGAAPGDARPQAHKRFFATRRWAEQALQAQGAGASQARAAQRARGRATGSAPAAPLAHLEANLFRRDAGQAPGDGAVELIEAADRVGEVRSAMHWLKARLAEGCGPGELGLLARDLAPYRAHILETAAEFGLPVYLAGGLPLAGNPAIAALLDLLRLALPAADGAGLALPPRLVAESWRSPYFDWSARPTPEAAGPIGIAAGDAAALEAAARWGRVLGGTGQWLEVLDELAARPQAGGPDAAAGDDERGVDPGVPTGPAAAALGGKFRRFTQRLSPPAGRRNYRDFVAWLEELIGPDPSADILDFAPPAEPTALDVVQRARAWPATAGRDLAALQVFKDVLRSLIWAEEALGGALVDYGGFFEELAGAAEAAAYLLPPRVPGLAILAADVVQARGLPLAAAALLGLAEGEFPAVLHEEPLLPDAERQRLRGEWDLPLELSTESAEAQHFYEAITRPRGRLLLTRPRLAEDGSPWQASPFWEEARRLILVEPVTLRADELPPSAQAASWPEWLACLAAEYGAGQPPFLAKAEEQAGHDRGDPAAAWAEVLAAAEIFRTRSRRTAAAGAAAAYDGDLGSLAGEFSARFGRDHTWSASRLEKYGSCPFAFFAGTVLGLEARAEPMAGLDVRQLGNIYHRILARVYGAAGDPGALGQLLAALPAAAQAVLDAAPRQEGFRTHAWWQQTRAEIEDNVRRSLEALAVQGPGYAPAGHEVPFFGDQTLTVSDGDDSFLLHGYIDRIDRGPGGCRIIDYKTGGPSDYTDRAVGEGLKLQLALYALAARDALGLGLPADGFYWHVTRAEASPFSLAGFRGGGIWPDGPAGAIAAATAAAWTAVRGARAGAFGPRPPAAGCPGYCPAAAFCWHYRQWQRGA